MLFEEGGFMIGDYNPELQKTPEMYNKLFYPSLNRACSFVNCLDHALQKSGEEAKRQCAIIGWGEDTKLFLIAALKAYDRCVRSRICLEAMGGEEHA